MLRNSFQFYPQFISTFTYLLAMANVDRTGDDESRGFARVLGTESEFIFVHLGNANSYFMKQAFSLFISLLPIYIYSKLRGKETDVVDRATNSDKSIIQSSELLHLL